MKCCFCNAEIIQSHFFILLSKLPFILILYYLPMPKVKIKKLCEVNFYINSVLLKSYYKLPFECF